MLPWRKRLAWGAGGVLLLWAATWLAVPPVLKWQMQARLSELLGRSLTIDSVSFHPWNLDLTVRGLTIGAAPSAPPTAEPLLHVGRLRANLSLASLFRLAPVIEALEADALQLRLARLSEGHYDVDDLIERFTPRADSPPSAEPAKFALYNVKVRDAELRFDDKPVGRVHKVEGLQLALPFLSNLPAQVEVEVEPHLAFKLNGTPFDSGAQATPFADTRHAELKLNVAGLDVAPYLGYLPESLPVRLTRGTLSADMALEFTQHHADAPSIALRGTLGARDLALNDAAGAPLLAWRELKLGLRDVQPLARKLAFDTLRIEGAQLHVARDASGRISLLQPAAAAAPAAQPAAAAAAPPWQVSLAAAELADARVLWNDAAVKPAAALQLDELSLSAKQVQWPMAGPMPLSLQATLRSKQGEGAAAAGRLTAEGSGSDREASLSATVSALSLQALAPYLAQVLTPSIQGRLSARARLDWSGADAQAPGLKLELAQATLDDLRVHAGVGGKGRGAAHAGAALSQLALADVQLDMAARTVALGSVSLTQPSLALVRDVQGQLNVAQWLRPSDAAAASKPAAATAEKATEATPEDPWRVQLHKLAIERGQIRWSDAAARRAANDEPLRVELNQLRLGMQELVWHGDKAVPPAKLQLSARLGSAAAARDSKAASAGVLDWKGELGLQPLQASGDLRVVRFPVHAFEAYFADRLPVSLLRAEAGYTGRVAVRNLPAGLDVTAAGDVLLGDVHVSTLASGSDELLSWQSFALKRLKFAMKPGARPQLEIGEAALSDFYSRLVVTEQGRFNLQEVAAAQPSVPASAAATSAPAEPASAAASAADAGGLPMDINVGATQLINGRVDFSDHFVRPNYSAALTDLNGQLGGFSSSSRAMAALQLRGRVAGTGVLAIDGQLNPSVKPLALDIQARATDIELSPLSPYAGKYAGYAIERGKLSVDVAYKIEADGQLEAKNQMVLNQLTFGERIESPEATKLPVLLAVALLKDRNGVIDVNLPVSGSVNDPQFSIGGIVLKLIGNLLLKALTAPFALLAGGGGEDLSHVEFTPGTAVITDAGQQTLAKVAKALGDRPALKMTVTGASDPAAEREAYQRAVLEARLLAERRSEGLRAGAASTSAARVPAPLGAADRSRLLRALYRQTDIPTKPRNVLGLAKDLPDAEMEALLRKQLPATPEAMRELALQRGLAVRDALIAKGLASERLFLAAPKLPAAGDGADAVWTSRARLSLSVH